MTQSGRLFRMLSVLALGSWLAGCGPEASAPAARGEKSPVTVQNESDDAPETASAEGKKRRKFKPIQLDASSSGGQDSSAEAEAREDSVVAALQDFQVLLGEWEGKTKKKFDGFAKVDNLEWIWDFTTNKDQPALIFKSDKSPYFKKGSLTFDTRSQNYRLSTVSPENEKRVFEGTWAPDKEPKRESDGKVMQLTYKLELAQTEPAEGEQYRVVFNQQENNRYLIELTRKPPKGDTFGPLDVVGLQRKNTSFAVADSDNPGPKCIISGGLGTMSVSYQGKSYPVCCSGCASAFNDDPERWLAKWAKQQAEKKTE